MNSLLKLKLEQKELKKDKKALKEKLKLLNSHINDLKHSLETIEYSKDKEILKLQEEYNKYKNKKLALKKVEKSANYYEEVSKKLKEFILKFI